jgi:hypothetical protein
MKDLLEFIVTHLVDHPEEVSIEEEERDRYFDTNLILKVSPADMGKIIGKNGKVIRAIRHLVRLPAMAEQQRVNIELVEPDEDSHSHSLS